MSEKLHEATITVKCQQEDWRVIVHGMILAIGNHFREVLVPDSFRFEAQPSDSTTQPSETFRLEWKTYPVENRAEGHDEVFHRHRVH